MNTLIIEGVEYIIDVKKMGNILNITATNNILQYSYVIDLDDNQIQKLTEDCKYNLNIDKFYDVLKIGLLGNESGVLLDCAYYKNINVITLYLTIYLIKGLGEKIVYPLNLQMKEKTINELMGGLFIEITKTRKEMEKLCLENIEIKKEIEKICRENMELKKEIENNIKKKREWYSISMDDPNYRFGHSRTFYLAPNSINKGALTLIESGILGLNPKCVCYKPYKLVIPDEIIKKSKKIRVIINTRSMGDNNRTCYIKLWTRSNDVRHVSIKAKNDYDSIIGLDAIGGTLGCLYYPTMSFEYTFNVSNTHSTLYVEGYNECKFNIYLTGYK